jgi:hypothetical protein
MVLAAKFSVVSVEVPSAGRRSTSVNPMKKSNGAAISISRIKPSADRRLSVKISFNVPLSSCGQADRYYADILLPLRDVLKRFGWMNKGTGIEDCNNKIMELTEQEDILSRMISKGYVETAVFIERQMPLLWSLPRQRKKEQLWTTTDLSWRLQGRASAGAHQKQNRHP